MYLCSPALISFYLLRRTVESIFSIRACVNILILEPEFNESVYSYSTMYSMPHTLRARILTSILILCSSKIEWVLRESCDADSDGLGSSPCTGLARGTRCGARARDARLLASTAPVATLRAARSVGAHRRSRARGLRLLVRT